MAESSLVYIPRCRHSRSRREPVTSERQLRFGKRVPGGYARPAHAEYR
jgi:hypothetical protein